MHRAICTGSRSKLNGPNAMLLGTGGITVARVNSNPFPSLVHSLNRGHGAFATPGEDNFSRGLRIVLRRSRSSQLLPQGGVPDFLPFPEELPGLQWESSGSRLRLTGRRSLVARKFRTCSVVGAYSSAGT